MTLNAAYVIGASGASAPPASITSARSSRIAWNASPTAMVPEAQLMALVEFGPVNPNSIAILQLAAPGNTASASAGSSPRGPSARNCSTCDSANATPPSADPIIAPTRSRSSRAGSRSASVSANREPGPQAVGPRADRRDGADAGDYDPPSTVLHAWLPVGLRSRGHFTHAPAHVLVRQGSATRSRGRTPARSRAGPPTDRPAAMPAPSTRARSLPPRRPTLAPAARPRPSRS